MLMRRVYTTDFVAHDPDTQSIVLAHQGTDVQNMCTFPSSTSSLTSLI